MALYRQVNGERIALTSEEEAAKLAEWDANKPPIYAVLIPAIKQEGLIRIQIIFPAIKDIDEAVFAIEQWLSIDLAARTPTPNFSTFISTVQAAKAAITNVKTFTTQAEVDAYDVLTGPAWP